MWTFWLVYVHVPPSLLEPGVITLMCVTTGEEVCKPLIWDVLRFPVQCMIMNIVDWAALKVLIVCWFPFGFTPWKENFIIPHGFSLQTLHILDTVALGHRSNSSHPWDFLGVLHKWFNQNHQSHKTTNYSTFELLYCFSHTRGRSQAKSLLQAFGWYLDCGPSA